MYEIIYIFTVWYISMYWISPGRFSTTAKAPELGAISAVQTKGGRVSPWPGGTLEPQPFIPICPMKNHENQSQS